ncbi:MAG: DciA family protein [Chloroflexota bacterium]
MSFRRLGDILPQTLEGLGIEQRVRQEQARRAWHRVAHRVSPALAAGAEAVELRGGVLMVRVPAGHLARMLEARTAELVRWLNAEVGDGIVESVVRVE